MEVRKMIVPEEFAGKPKDEVLQAAKQLLSEQQASEGANALDTRIRSGNLHTLQKLIDDHGAVRNSHGENIRSEAQRQADVAAAKQKVDEDRKSAIMHEIRSRFAGSDADWERLKDRLYDEYLASHADREAAAAQNRVSTSLKSIF